MSDSDDDIVLAIRQRNRRNTPAATSTLGEESDSEKGKRQDSEGFDDLGEALETEASTASPKYD
jgi:hypothetical protein